MPISETQSLTTIATNSNLRIHERIRLIKGEDRKISSPEEANAILSIPSKDVILTDNKEALTLSKREAASFLKYGDKNLQDSLKTIYNYIVKEGSTFISKVSNYFNPDKAIAQN